MLRCHARCLQHSCTECRSCGRETTLIVVLSFGAAVLRTASRVLVAVSIANTAITVMDTMITTHFAPNKTIRELHDTRSQMKDGANSGM